MQPKWLIAQLEEFGFQSYFQSSMSETIRKELLVVESIGVEHSARLDNDVLRLYNLFKSLKRDQQERLEIFRRQEQQTELTFEERTSELLNAENAVDETAQEQKFWQSQFNKAQNWLSSTESRLDIAQSELVVAQRRVASAQSEYNSAVSAYNYASSQQIRVYAGRDRDGNDKYRYEQNPANAERARMNAAQSSLSTAESRQGVAISAVNAAKREKEKAVKQVNGASAAVNDTNNAKKNANSSLTSAQEAKSHTNNAKTSLETICSVLEVISDNLLALENCIERQSVCQHQLKQNNESIISTLNNNDQVREELSYEVYKIRQALEDKINLLAVFDRPIFMG